MPMPAAMHARSRGSAASRTLANPLAASVRTPPMPLVRQSRSPQEPPSPCPARVSSSIIRVRVIRPQRSSASSGSLASPS